MIVKRKTISFWYIVIGLSFLSVLIWFFVEFASTRESTTVSKEAKEAAKVLPDTIKTSVIEELQKRQIISDIELESTQPYTGKSSQKPTGSQASIQSESETSEEDLVVKEASPSSETAQ